jgi:hypothetical protein
MPSKGFSKFDIDLAYGLGRENEFARLLGPASIEVKSDRQAHRTGNIYVEFESRGKPGGIAVTESEWWVQEIAEWHRFIVMPTEQMRRFVQRERDAGRVRLGGDVQSSKGVLLKMTDLVKEI